MYLHRLIFFLASVWCVSSGDLCSSSNYITVYSALFNKLDLLGNNTLLTHIRPTSNKNQVTWLFAALYVTSITDVNEKAQSISTQVRLLIYWRTGLSWSSSEFCGIQTFATQKDLIWTPDIAVLESIKTEYASHDSQYVLLYCYGYVDMVDILSLTTVCKMDMYMFPFDTQNCSITLRSLMHTVDQLKFAESASAEHLTFQSQKVFQTQGEWELIEIKTTTDVSNDLWLSQSRMIFQITIKRRPLLYIINLIFPVFCFLVLDVSSFFIKASQSEKLGFKVTLLLSISVLLLILNDKLPSTSSRIPLIGIYCGGVFSLIGISILETVFVNVLILKAEKLKLKPPEETKPAPAAPDEPNGLDIRPDIPLHNNDVAWWNVLESVFVNVLIVKEEEETNPQTPEETRTAPTDQDEDAGDFNSPDTDTSTTEEKTRTPNTRNKASRCWIRAARIIDAIFFVIYIITIIVFFSFLGKVWFVM